MQALADLLREARQRNVLTVDDLYLDEPHVIALLLSDPVLTARWQDYCRIIGTRSGAQKPEGTYAVKIAAKSAASTRWCRRATAFGASPQSMRTMHQSSPPSARMTSTAGSGPNMNKGSAKPLASHFLCTFDNRKAAGLCGLLLFEVFG